VPTAVATFPDLDGQLLDELTAGLVRASAAIVAVGSDALATRRKDDESPVTAADEASQAVILEELARLVPGLPVVSEEALAACPRPLGDDFVLVDPLDGTREFIAGHPEYTVNVALVRQHRPVAGLVAAPALGLIWRGVVGRGAERLRFDCEHAHLPGPPAAIRTRLAPDRLVIALSRSHLDADTAAFANRLPIAQRLTCGSALKFCRIAEGEADVYPRLSPTCEWDVAAGHAVLAAAGGVVAAPDGTPITYGRFDEDFRIPGFVAWGDPDGARRYES
jgi:3'(2'), 5'-bisphosphate nucleotidase